MMTRPITDISGRGIPSAWGQAFPRSVRLAPDGFFVPSGTLRVLSGKSGRIEISYEGHAFEPWVRHSGRAWLDATRTPRPGDLIVCDVDGWADLRRVLRRTNDGWISALDPLPGGRETVRSGQVMGVVGGTVGAGGLTGRAIVLSFPCWSRLAALAYWLRKALSAPDFGDDAARSVRDKYSFQVDTYTEMLRHPIGASLRSLFARTFPAGGSILVAACGAGNEAIQLARAGYRVSGFDVLEEMVIASRRNAIAAGVEIEFLRSDMAELDLAGRAFDGIYVTPLVYSFVSGRARRLRCLRRLGRHLSPGACLVYSGHLYTNMAQRLQATLVWARHRPRRSGFEFGDWFTWFLRADGSIGRSFTHLFRPSAVLDEAREAGFQECRADGAYFVAGRFAPENDASIAGQKS